MKLHYSKEFLEAQLRTKHYTNIAKEIGVSVTTIQRKMSEFELTGPYKKWLKSEIDFLKNNYGSPALLLERFPKRTLSSIYHKANRLGLERPFRPRYNAVNEDFFSSWTRESAYVLGWLYSDGNVTQDLRTFRFHISIRDIKIMEKIKSVICSEHKIAKHDKYIRFQVHSRKMVRDLVELGCGPRKAHKIDFPKAIPRQFISHFVRGYFDGDGSISFNFPNTIRIRFVGNQQFMKSLAKVVYELLDLKMNVREMRPPLWKAEVCGNNARNVCKWMYSGCGDLRLERKYLRYITHLNKRHEIIPLDVYSSDSDS